MSEQARPWWASDGPVDGGIDRDEDPVERFRAARRGGAGSEDAGAAGADGADGAAGADGALDEPWLDAVAATMTRLADTSAPDGDGDDEATAPHSPDVCGVCPICVGLRALADSRPELVGHLAEAARHLALAARSLRERPQAGSGRAGARAGEPLEHIDLE